VARLLSVNVGLPRDVPWRGKTAHTSVWKASVAGVRELEQAAERRVPRDRGGTPDKRDERSGRVTHLSISAGKPRAGIASRRPS
jgi:hypothetical protein